MRTASAWYYVRDGQQPLRFDFEEDYDEVDARRMIRKHFSRCRVHGNARLYTETEWKSHRKRD